MSKGTFEAIHVDGRHGHRKDERARAARRTTSNGERTRHFGVGPYHDAVAQGLSALALPFTFALRGLLVFGAWRTTRTALDGCRFVDTGGASSNVSCGDGRRWDRAGGACSAPRHPDGRRHGFLDGRKLENGIFKSS